MILQPPGCRRFRLRLVCPLAICLSTGTALATPAPAPGPEFEASFLYLSPGQPRANVTHALHALSDQKELPPGRYPVQLLVNLDPAGVRELQFELSPDGGQLVPCLAPSLMAELGLRLDAIADPTALEHACLDLPRLVPGALVDFDASHLRLAISIPQIALRRDMAGQVDPARWENGMLTKITDMKGVTLLDVSRTGNRVGLTLPSDAGSATYTLVLGNNNRVDRIELPTENLASWRFTYARVRNVDCISTVRTPAGGFEEIAYGDGGHLFPIGSGITPLPRVTRHLQHPGHGQPAIDTRYTYSSNGHNFLGGNVRLDWRDDGLDNLFRQAMDYNYATTETLWVDDKPVRSTVREFNKFHLNTREAVYRGSRLNGDRTEVIGNNIEEKTISYDLRAGRFEEQVNACQLPVKVQTRWRVLDSSRQREEEVTTTYDDYGNVLTQKAANGIVETSRWYRNGDDGYPGNAEKFVCDLHTKTVTPAAGHPGGAPTLVTTCRYKAIKVLASSSEATR
ncbi:MAG: FimD/PapC N-terminal domain-containing protein, partial [Pseudomonas putida]